MPRSVTAPVLGRHLAPALAPAPPPLWAAREPSPAVEDDDSSDDDLGGYGEVNDFAGATSTGDPRTWREAMARSDAEQCDASVRDEIHTLIGNGTWEIVELPPRAKAIPSGWVFKTKRTPDGKVERCKARIVAKGCNQRPGVDYFETFAPTFRPAAFRNTLAAAGIEDMHLRSADFSSAFTNGDLNEVIHMRQPEGFHQGGPNMVCLLKKSLYGLKQGARQWNKKLHETFLELGFTRLISDRSVYLFARDDVRIIVPVYIDDVTLASKSQESLDRTVEELSKRFKLQDLGETKFILGVEIIRDRPNRTISLSQCQYIIDILERYGFSDCNPVGTPLPTSIKLSKAMGPKTPQEVELMRDIPYLSVLGSVLYLATMTRPDISYAVSFLGRFSANPGPPHWFGLKHLLRYLKGTMDYKLTYNGKDVNSVRFDTYCDASHGDCLDSGRSTGGYVTTMAGGAISWSSKLQTIVALSSTEAEYMVAVEAGKEILWMRNILGEFGFPQDSSSLLHIDNQSAINVSKNPEHFGRMKHLDLRFFWLRDVVDAGTITPVKIKGTEHPADCLTKALPLPSIRLARDMLGLRLD